MGFLDRFLQMGWQPQQQQIVQQPDQTPLAQPSPLALLGRVPQVMPGMRPIQGPQGPALPAPGPLNLGGPVQQAPPPPPPSVWQRLAGTPDGEGGVEGGLFQNPMFMSGMALLGAAQPNGGGWGRAAADVSGIYANQNQMRRQRRADEREDQRFGWQQTQNERTERQRIEMERWIATLPESEQAAARANPEAAYVAFMEARAAANAPITPYQRAQLEQDASQFNADIGLRRRGLEIDAARVNMDRPLRGPDATLLNGVRESADRGQAMLMLSDQFAAANEADQTGQWTRWFPSNFWDQDRAAMRSASAQMRGFMRPPGSGATSDFEQRLYGMGAPSVDNSREQNEAIIAGHRTGAQLATARRDFFEAWAQAHGNLYGAEQAFQSSPAFRSAQTEFTRRYGEGRAREPSQVVAVQSPQDAQRLPRGTRYRTPDGREFVR